MVFLKVSGPVSLLTSIFPSLVDKILKLLHLVTLNPWSLLSSSWQRSVITL